MQSKQGMGSEVCGCLWLDKVGEAFPGRGRIELLRHIDAQGSLSAAAREMGMSYKAAWQAVDAMDNLADKALVERAISRRNGGGTRLTDEGRRMVEMFGTVESAYRDFFLGSARGGPISTTSTNG